MIIVLWQNYLAAKDLITQGKGVCEILNQSISVCMVKREI